MSASSSEDAVVVVVTVPGGSILRRARLGPVSGDYSLRSRVRFDLVSIESWREV
jgi:hypothetical protein